MAWVYEQSTGRLTREGEIVAVGYAGFGVGQNNPEMQHVRDTGPLPQGTWRILPPQEPVRQLGPLAMPLEPVSGETFGRDDFLIHGDSTARNRTASTGCIVLPIEVRRMIWESGDRELVVVA
ncbi:MAG: DUF2778 domain-containing protein [Proteobacteria bacterium]|nr:DUF2778 domain-containing protein [Pseudomonadota bacterium]